MKIFLYMFLILPSLGLAHSNGKFVHFHFEGTLILIFFALLLARSFWRNNK